VGAGLLSEITKFSTRLQRPFKTEAATPHHSISSEKYHVNDHEPGLCGKEVEGVWITAEVCQEGGHCSQSGMCELYGASGTGPQHAQVASMNSSCQHQEAEGGQETDPRDARVIMMDDGHPASFAFSRGREGTTEHEEEAAARRHAEASGGKLCGVMQWIQNDVFRSSRGNSMASTSSAHWKRGRGSSILVMMSGVEESGGVSSDLHEGVPSGRYGHLSEGGPAAPAIAQAIARAVLQRSSNEQQ
jgi:hypothetical protein